MTSPFIEQIHRSLESCKASGLHRRRVMRNANDAWLNFSSNDYLSLSTDPALQQAYQVGCQQYPVGSGGSALVCGYHPIHRELEQAFSSALGVEDALFVSSGYVANLSLMALFSSLGAVVYLDKAIHASVYDGACRAGLSFKRYLHCDVHDLRKKWVRDEPGVMMTESIFSMSGQQAPLREFVQMLGSSSMVLCVDEAHAFGVVGPQGLGAVKALDLTPDEVPLRVIPLGKAMAGSGAIIAGQSDWIDALVQSSRPYMYSTAPSPALAYGLLYALDRVRSADDRRLKLMNLIHYFRESIAQSSWTWRDSNTAIQQLQIGCPHQAQALSERLHQHSILCTPIRQPTVSRPETGLRVILNYHHQPEDIDSLFRCLQ